MAHWILHANVFPPSVDIPIDGYRREGVYYEGKKVEGPQEPAYTRGMKVYAVADLEHFVAGYHKDPVDVSSQPLVPFTPDGMAQLPHNHADRLADLLGSFPAGNEPLVLQVEYPIATDPLIIAKYDRFEVWVLERSRV